MQLKSYRIIRIKKLESQLRKVLLASLRLSNLIFLGFVSIFLNQCQCKLAKSKEMPRK